jgi:DNA-binding NarL/FixJ family response regulator
METPVRILIIENQTLVKIGIRAVLSAKDDFEIVGEAGSGAEGFQKFSET